MLVLIKKEPIMLLKSLLGYSLIGTIMFFIRSCETNFYTILECNCIRDYLEYSDDKETNKNKTLISMISKSMNYEFMCCIMYGLSDIFYKKNLQTQKEEKKKKLQEFNKDLMGFGKMGKFKIDKNDNINNKIK
jgi:hypothetical protein